MIIMIIPYLYIRYFFFSLAFVGLPVLALILLKIFQKLTVGKCKSLVCLSGKTAIVTGGASGIGYETALQLASRGCRVMIADKYSSLRAAKKITRITHNPNVLHKYLDLASLKSVREFAKDINETEERLDILINNAVAASVGNNHTEDELHETMQTNHFGPFLLTHLLADLLKKSAPSRIIFVSSAAAFFSNLSIENLNYPKDHPLSFFRTGLIYGNSKLCNVIAANGFAKRLEDYGVTCNSLHPGWVSTNNLKLPDKSVGLEGIDQMILSPISYVYGKNQREGAQTILHVTMSDSLKNVTGKHFWDCVTFPLPPGARNEKFCQDIWAESEIFVKLNESEKLPLPTLKISEEKIEMKEERPPVTIGEEEEVGEFMEEKGTDEEETLVDNSDSEISDSDKTQEIQDDNHEQICKKKEVDEESLRNGQESILRFRKINDRENFLNMNDSKEHDEEKERS